MRLNFPGVPVYMNGRRYYIPSLSTRQYRENSEVLGNPPTPTEQESAAAYLVRVSDVVLPIIALAIRRNYPEVTDDQLADWLDGSSLMTAWKATQNASGMEPLTEGEDQPTTAETPTGSPSTDVSPQL